ncbi:formylglycine-generating enzyme family protein [Zoogloea sp.]|uniref:formylglycine-generating enzyme family protein n=1 Tax=Zoogloea sp. TaxID=49181 RepID=UPI002611D78A|nr:formylglycine-generating enzyme family protein [uncultured Zoogloea sp.]
MASLPLAGRADLLRALAAGYGKCAEAVSDEELSRLAEALELHPQLAEGKAALVEMPYGAGDGPIDTPDQTTRSPEPRPARRPPLQARFFAVLQASPAPESEPRQGAAPEPLRAADCAPRLTGEPPILPLVPRTRLWPALRRSLARPHAAGLDVPALVRRLARAENVRRLPRRRGCASAGEVWVVVDRVQRLLPYDSDFEQIIDEFVRLHGAASLHRWEVCESPDAVLWTRQGRGAHHGFRGRIPVPPLGTPVLILGDLGLLSAGRGQESAWLAFCRRLRDGGADPVAWLPLSPRLVSREAARHARVHCLGGDLQPVRPGRCVEKPPLPAAALDGLLTRLACCVRVEPALLRSLRLMQPDGAAEPGLEALVWGHPSAVTAGYRFCEIARPSQADYRARFAALGSDLQDEILRRMLVAHAHRGRSTETVEALIWRAHTGREAPPGEPAERLAEAIAWLPRVAASGGLRDVAGYARDLMCRQGGDRVWVDAHSAAIAPLWLMTGEPSIPAGLRSEDIEAASGGLPSPLYCHLAQRNGRLFIEQVPEQGPVDGALWFTWKNFNFKTDEWFESPRGRLTGAAFQVRNHIEWARDDGAFRYWLAPPGDELMRELPLGDSPGGALFTLRTGSQTLRLGLLSRPSWATEWGFDTEGLYAQAPSPLGGEVRLHATPWAPEAWQGGWPPGPRAFQASPVPLGQGMQMGADLQFGLYLDVQLGSAAQRFRWIEPGEFVMGSPEDEEGRDESEGPQHTVRLTEGFWLADSACSQALWVAVMGENPSRLKDEPEKPVDRVSWNDVSNFLRVMEGLLPGVKVELPSEAEWEYACRAGRQTVFNWDAGNAPKRALQDALGYMSGSVDQLRQTVLAVKSFAPNDWGLYQMHGNVWEWCADGLRNYESTSQVNPRGSEGEEEWRVVRGGSWLDDPRRLRSATRGGRPRDGRRVDQGFRFLLRGTSQRAEHSPEALATQEVLGMPIEPLTIGDERASYLDHVAQMIEGRQGGTGSVPWSQLRHTIPGASNKSRETKRAPKK